MNIIKKIKTKLNLQKLMYKFLIPLTLVFLLLLGGFTIFLVSSFQSEERERFEQNIERTTEIIANTSVSYLWDFDFERLENNAEYFFQDEELVSLIIRDEDGEEKIILEGDRNKGQEYKNKEDIYYNEEVIGEVELIFTDYFLQRRIKELRNNLIIFSMIIFAFLVTLVWLISKREFEPLGTTRNFALEIARGNLETSDLKINKQDEVGELSRALNEMKNELHNIIRDIVSLTEDLTGFDEMSERAEQVLNSAREVGRSVEELASGTEEQSAQAEEMTATVEKMSAQIDSTEEKVQRMESNTEDVIKDIEQGDNYIKEAVSQINEVKVITQDTESEMETLNKVSIEIGEIIEMISEISEQTNLLALNAAIEAARAGKAGQGFSVVADEIRQLAEKTARSTEEVEKLIKKINQHVDSATESMSESTEVVNDGVHDVQKAGDKFDEVLQNSRELAKFVKEVSDNTMKMKDIGSLVENNVNEIATVSERAASNTENVAASTDKQIKDTERIIEQIQDLIKRTKKLMDKVDNFEI
ncbi:MAG: methyl-accepting chemotaxis protein [Halanaerobium sp.]